MTTHKTCPEGHEGSLYSVETVIAHYPVTVDEEGIDYTGEESRTFDESAVVTGLIFCSECGDDYKLTALIDPPDEEE